MMRLKSLVYIVLLFIFQSLYSQNDCTKALIVCGNSSYTGLSATGEGIQELNSGNTCEGQENNSLWFKATIKTAGTLGFTLTPTNPNINVDFDFFVFGPNVTCGNIGSAIRCSTTNPQAAGLSSNTTGMNGTETDQTEGPVEFGNSFVKWLTVAANDTYFIVIDRPPGTGSSNFSLAWTGTATFYEPPAFENTTAGATLDLAKCDSDAMQDNKTAFDLTSNSSLAIGTQTNIDVTYHTTSNNAITGLNSISNPTTFQNTLNPQEIFIRLTNPTTGCFSTSSFFITVTPLQSPSPLDLSSCDLDNDGFVTFNLSDNDATLINGNPDFVVTYHPTNNDTAVLPNNYTNQVSNTDETVWAKIKDTSSGCYVYKSFKLIINEIPNTTAAQLEQCDFGLLPDGLTTFNLIDANPALTNSDANLSTKFYLNVTDAQNDANVLNDSYTNTSNPQTLSVRLTDNSTQCYSITTLTLNANINPSIIADLERCDDDGTEDGLALFDLTNAGFATNGYSVTYYETLNDALLEQNPIMASFTNTVAGQQTVYARLESDTACYGINAINLFVRPLPNIETIGSEIFCANKPNSPTILDAGIISGDPSSLTYLWTPGGETTPTINVFSAGTYSVRVTSNYGCYKDRTITVNSSNIATIQDIDVVDFSDENTVTVFVSGDEDAFEYSIDLPNGPFQDSNYFANVESGIHTVYVSDKNGCGNVTKQIAVLGAPKFFTPNGDGYNDIWKIKGLSPNLNRNTTINIFDQFGKLIKQIRSTTEGWDGSYNGRSLPENDYWYTISLEDGRTVKGHFALIY